MNELVPLVGLKGRFKFKEPFKSSMNENAIYTVKAVRVISEMMNEDLEVYDIIYKPHNIPYETFQEHFDNDVKIVVLESESRTIYNIPAVYLASLPEKIGEIYVGKGMMISFNYVPVNLDLDFLKDFNLL